jgi:hypothetical protein
MHGTDLNALAGQLAKLSPADRELLAALLLRKAFIT